MRKKVTTALAILCAVGAAACQEHIAAPVSAQDVPQAAMRDGRFMAGPGSGFLGFILANADELELTADQRSRLENVRATLDERSSPLIARVREELGSDSIGRGAMRGATAEQRAAIRPLLQELRTVRREAMEEAGGVLTASQRQELRSLRPGRAGRGDQRFQRADRPAGGEWFGGGAALALRHAEQIGLTDTQRVQLEELVAELRAERESRRAEAGQPLSREEREARVSMHRERVESILTADQLTQLRSLRPRPAPMGQRRGPRGGG